MAVDKCNRCGFFEADEKIEEIIDEFFGNTVSEVWLDAEFRHWLKELALQKEMHVCLREQRLCRVCSLVWCYTQMIRGLSAVDEDNDKVILGLLNGVLGLEAERVAALLRNVVINEDKKLRPRTRDVNKNFWRIALKLFQAGKQPRNVLDSERKLIKILRKGGYSIGDLAYVFDRSKATIHENLRK